MQAKEDVQRKMAGILDTVRSLKDDPVASASYTIIYASDVSEAYFCRELPRKAIEEMTQAYLKDLPEEYERLGKLVEKLEQLELAHEAGILSNDGKEFKELVGEFSMELGLYESLVDDPW